MVSPEFRLTAGFWLLRSASSVKGSSLPVPVGGGSHTGPPQSGGVTG
jgi:hypothetical protein